MTHLLGLFIVGAFFMSCATKDKVAREMIKLSPQLVEIKDPKALVKNINDEEDAEDDYTCLFSATYVFSIRKSRYRTIKVI